MVACEGATPEDIFTLALNEPVLVVRFKSNFSLLLNPKPMIQIILKTTLVKAVLINTLFLSMRLLQHPWWKTLFIVVLPG